MRTLLSVIAAALVSNLGCTAPSPSATVDCTRSGWRVAQTTDSVLAFCVPPDFAQVNQSGFWTKAVGDSTPAFVRSVWIHLAAVPASDVASDNGPWPPSL